MILKKWDELPSEFHKETVRYYYDCLAKKKVSLLCKRIFDIVAASVLLLLLSPLFLVLAVAIKLDSNGPVFYRQERVTAYGKRFRIFKFRTMVSDADQKGTLLTRKNDMRITRIGKLIRRGRLDEIPQLLNVFTGEMSFVGTRPEVPKYVRYYSDEMLATLLLPAGITSEACIRFKDEDELLADAVDIDRQYAEMVLPLKMKHNLKAIEQFSFWVEIATMFRTVFAVLGKDYSEKDAVVSEITNV